LTDRDLKGIAANKAFRELEISHREAVVAFTSSYLLGQAFGSIIFPTFTEKFGRRKTYISATIAYSLTNVIVAAAGSYHVSGVVVGRCVSGMLSAIPTVVAAGSIEDMFSVRARIMPIQFWVGCSILGLSHGPLLAFVIERSLGW
jgi:MFS family permease